MPVEAMNLAWWPKATPVVRPLCSGEGRELLTPPSCSPRGGRGLGSPPGGSLMGVGSALRPRAQPCRAGGVPLARQGGGGSPLSPEGDPEATPCAPRPSRSPVKWRISVHCLQM